MSSRKKIHHERDHRWARGGDGPGIPGLDCKNYTPPAEFNLHPTPQKNKLHPPFPKLGKNPFCVILDQGQCQQQAKTRKSPYI